MTYTDPELASVGLSAAAARTKGIAHEVLRWPFTDNDRARAERQTAGMVKLVAGRRGRILGAAMVGAGAGELILPWVLAVGRGLKLGAMAGMVVPYPTLGEVSKRVAGAYYAPTPVQPAHALAGALAGQARMTVPAWRRWLPLVALLTVAAGVYVSGLHHHLSMATLHEERVAL